MWCIFILFLFQGTLSHSQAFPSFGFTGTYGSSSLSTLSYASLESEKNLPDTFILCSSTKQARFDEGGFYSIYGQDSGLWLTLEIHTYSNSVKLASDWDNKFHILGQIHNPKIDYWYHICQRIDLPKKIIEFAVNGEFLGEIVNDNVTNIPEKLRMDIGIGYRRQQFHGSVSNVRLFKEGNILDISASPCTPRAAIFLPWNPENWKIVGPNWSMQEELNETMCIPSDHYNLAIPVQITIDDAMHFCRNMLNNSIIPFPQDLEAFYKYTAWHEATTDDSCSSVWTPFSDENTEGTFLNMNDNTSMPLEQEVWKATEPNGGKDENYVKISISRRELYDVGVHSLSCSTCQISNNLLLQLDGVCQGSFMGKCYIQTRPK